MNTQAIERRRAASKAYHAANRDRLRPLKRAYYLANREHLLAVSKAARLRRLETDGELERAKKRASHTLRRYGLTQADLDGLWASQDGRCFLCRRELAYGTGRYAIDHAPKTTRVRGLLCVPCNTALGSLGDDEAGLVRALDYVKSPPAEIALARLRPS